MIKSKACSVYFSAVEWDASNDDASTDVENEIQSEDSGYIFSCSIHKDPHYYIIEFLVSQLCFIFLFHSNFQRLTYH